MPAASTHRPATTPAAELERITAQLARHPAGIGVDALQAALQHTITRRSLQRRLAQLLAGQRVLREGAGPATRYRLAGDAPVAAGAVTEAAAVPAAQPRHLPLTYQVQEPPPGQGASAGPLALGGSVPLSAGAAELRALIRRPLQERRPVAYDPHFLAAYSPNRVFYLSDSLRSQLLAMGRSGVAQRAPAGTFARDILGRLLIDLSWASSRLEGNTYSRLDTERLIEFGQAAQGKDALETQMILNHKSAIEFLAGDASVAVDTGTMLSLHALLADGLLHDAAAAGRVRRRAVEIGGSVFRPLAMPQQLEELFGIVLQMAGEIHDPFEQAFFLMVHLPYLQPFEDVNKRVSRLAANIPLLRHNLCPLSFIDVPAQDYVDGTLAVYELNRVDLLRDVFVWAYERSCQQYVAVKQQLVPPDLFRLRYRAEIGTAVKALVQQGLALGPAQLKRVTPAAVAPKDRARFAQQLLAEFESLHEGNAVRFGLRPLELAQWRKLQTPPPAKRRRG